MVEPRTTVDIVRDLIAVVLESEWTPIWDSCCRCSGDCQCKADGCRECGGYKRDDPPHETGCKVSALITEAEAYLRVEEAFEGERAAKAGRQ